jgi:hypothetical protein
MVAGPGVVGGRQGQKQALFRHAPGHQPSADALGVVRIGAIDQQVLVAGDGDGDSRKNRFHGVQHRGPVALVVRPGEHNRRLCFPFRRQAASFRYRRHGGAFYAAAGRFAIVPVARAAIFCAV